MSIVLNTIVHHPLFYIIILLLVIAYFVSMFLPEKRVKKNQVYIVHTSKIGAKFGEWRNK